MTSHTLLCKYTTNDDPAVKQREPTVPYDSPVKYATAFLSYIELHLNFKSGFMLFKVAFTNDV